MPARDPEAQGLDATEGGRGVGQTVPAALFGMKALPPLFVIKPP